MWCRKQQEATLASQVAHFRVSSSSGRVWTPQPQSRPARVSKAQAVAARKRAHAADSSDGGAEAKLDDGPSSHVHTFQRPVRVPQQQLTPCPSVAATLHSPVHTLSRKSASTSQLPALRHTCVSTLLQRSPSSKLVPLPSSAGKPTLSYTASFADPRLQAPTRTLRNTEAYDGQPPVEAPTPLLRPHGALAAPGERAFLNPFVHVLDLHTLDRRAGEDEEGEEEYSPRRTVEARTESLVPDMFGTEYGRTVRTVTKPAEEVRASCVCSTEPCTHTQLHSLPACCSAHD